MIVGVFEVYSEGGSNCVMFLTEQEAKDQTILSPSDGPYPMASGLFLFTATLNTLMMTKKIRHALNLIGEMR